MKKIICSIVLGCMAFSGWGQNPNPNVAVDNAILDQMDSELLPGVSTVIVKGGEIVWIQSYGLADVPNNVSVTDSTAFMLASVSKLFTGTALMQLADGGIINLDTDINHHLPFPIEIPNFESDSITFRQLMTHTSSIMDADVMDTYYSSGDPTITLANCIQRFFSPTGTDYSAVNNFHNNAPGTVYDYSNIATALSGYLVEVITQTPFDQYCREHIFDALCMENTDWNLSYFDTNQVARPHQYVNNNYQALTHYGFADYPDGQLRSDVQDIANFMITFLNNGSLNGNQILSSAAVSAMLTPQVSSLDETQGLNWYTEVLYTPNSEVTVWGHNGGESGVSTDLYIDPATGIGVAVFSNGEGDCLGICDELYTYALGLSATGVGVPSCLASLNELQNLENKIQPNPFDQSTDIYFNNPQKEKVYLQLTDFSGKLVDTSISTTDNLIHFEKGNLEVGIYLYTITTGKNAVLGKGKLIIQ